MVGFYSKGFFFSLVLGRKKVRAMFDSTNISGVEVAATALSNVSLRKPPREGDDIEVYLLTELGPRSLPLNWLIPLTAIYTFIFITGRETIAVQCHDV